jgi:hypothetical protein
MQSFITEGQTVLIKFRYLIRTESSYREDLNIVRLLPIYKIDYKIVLYKTYYNCRLEAFFKTSVAS